MYYKDLLYFILNCGENVSSHFGNTKECYDVKLKIPSHYNFPCFKNNRTFEHCWKYEKHELAWYWSGNRSHDYISNHASLWKDITNYDGTLNSNYGYLVYYKRPMRMGTHSSFNWALDNLIKDKNSRRAVVLYNSRDFNYLHNKDYICTQEQHFMIRNNELICIIPLRSSDAIYGLTFNMPWWSLVQQDLRLRLLKYYPELKLGEIIVNIHSAHIYEKHFELVHKMIHDETDYYFIKMVNPISLCLDKTESYYYEHMDEFIKIEQY